MNRRGFLGSTLLGALSLSLDPEQLLWTPSKKIFIPSLKRLERPLGIAWDTIKKGEFGFVKLPPGSKTAPLAGFYIVDGGIYNTNTPCTIYLASRVKGKKTIAKGAAVYEDDIITSLTDSPPYALWPTMSNQVWVRGQLA